jgi:hypothetical protein
MGYAEYPQFLFIESDSSEHQSVALERLYGIYAHTSHELLNLMVPCSQQIDEAFESHIRIEPFYQLRPLRRNTPVALAGLAAAA